MFRVGSTRKSTVTVAPPGRFVFEPPRTPAFASETLKKAARIAKETDAKAEPAEPAPRPERPLIDFDRP